MHGGDLLGLICTWCAVPGKDRRKVSARMHNPIVVIKVVISVDTRVTVGYRRACLIYLRGEKLHASVTLMAMSTGDKCVFMNVVSLRRGACTVRANVSVQ